MALPVKINLISESELQILWDNGNDFRYPLHFLRDETPDAGNKGETVLWKHYPALKKEKVSPEGYKIKDIEPVGNYGIKIVWQDGYDYGIYSWDILEQMGEFLKIKNEIKAGN